MEISLLQFTYDTLFFLEDSMQNIMCMKATIKSFELVSRLKVNFLKSCLGSIGMEDFSTYLGMLIY